GTIGVRSTLPGGGSFFFFFSFCAAAGPAHTNSSPTVSSVPASARSILGAHKGVNVLMSSQTPWCRENTTRVLPVAQALLPVPPKPYRRVWAGARAVLAE